MRVVLASASPQRREILERLGVDFDVAPSDVEEMTDGDPADVVLENARRKAHAVAEPGTLTIGCDTDVAIDGRLLGKPADEEQAYVYLEKLAGRAHDVVSGIVVLGPGETEERSGYTHSTVTLHDLTQGQAERYVASGEWRGRAGGYAIQGLGSTLVARVDGEVANVIGLPIGLLLELAPELLARPA